MILLLDTHVVIWWDSNPARVPAHVGAALLDPAHRKLLSVVSVWEMQIKVRLGKLALRLPLVQIIRQQQANRIEVLPVSLDHVLTLDALPSAHKDPFDRLLAAQAIVEGAELVTADPIFAQYPVRILW